MWDFNITAFRYHDVPFAIPFKTSTFTVIMSDIPDVQLQESINKAAAYRICLHSACHVTHIQHISLTALSGSNEEWVGFPF